MQRDRSPPKRIRVLTARAKKPKSVAAIRDDLRTPTQLRAELRRVFPSGVPRAAFCEELRRRLEGDDLCGVEIVNKVCYWRDPVGWSGPVMSDRLRELWCG